jgi:ketosteroid isomerase-like protein
MSHENVEVIRRTIERLDKGELAPEYYDPEIEWVTMPDSPLRTSYTGLTGLQRSLESIQEAWESMSVEAREFIESDEVIVAVLHFKVRSHSGVELDLDQGWAYWMRNGKIWRIEQHGTKQEALGALGLRE